MNFNNCKAALCSGKRARRKSWRDIGQYITSSYRGKHCGGLPAADCHVYLLGDRANIIAWPDMNAELLQSDWEIMPEPDYEAFGRAVFAYINDRHPDKRELELLAKHGMAHHVTYNSNLHGPMYATEGDMVWYLGD